MTRQNTKITSEEDAKVDAQADADPDRDPREDDLIETGPAPKAAPGTALTAGTEPQPGTIGGTVRPAGVRDGFVSAGIASDVELYGSTIDPATGLRITKADLDAAGYQPPASE